MNRHHGLSLLEVIVAMAILVASTAVIGQLVGMGRRHLQRAEDFTQAQTICLNKLNALLAGTDPLEAIESQPVHPMLPWNYSVSISPAGPAGLQQVTVEVVRIDPNSPPVMATTRTAGAAYFRLVRWIRRPTVNAIYFERNGASHRFREVTIPRQKPAASAEPLTTIGAKVDGIGPTVTESRLGD